MKVDSAGTQEKLYQNTVRGNRDETSKEKEPQVKNSTVFAGDLNLIQDPVAKRREEARKEAMGLLQGQFKADLEIDEDIEKRQSHIDEVREENDYASKQIARLQDDMKKMKEEYGLDDNSPELLGIREEIGHWKKQIADGDKTIKKEIAVVKATKQALLGRKYDMTDAAYAAEDVMDAASKDIIGLLKKEALDKMDEDRKDEQEKIEEAKEKKEEKEELIEKAREQDKKEELTREKIAAVSDTEKQKLQQEIDELLAKQKLLHEDIKGLAVDLTA